MQWIYAIISMMAYGLFFLSCCTAGFFYYDVNAAKNILITSYCIVTQIVQVKSRGKCFIYYEEYRKLIGNKSVFDENELKEKYDTLTDIMLIEILYLGYFGAGNNVNWAWLKNNGYWPNTYPMSILYSKEQFCKILQEGNVDVENVIIN